MIALFINYFNCTQPERQREYDIALIHNLENPHIDEVYLLGKDLPPADRKITRIPLEGRPTYRQFFEEINFNVGDDDISIVSNSDIFFDDTLTLVRQMNPHDCYALSRWDESKIVQVFGDSQDCWIFRGLIKPVNYCDFPLGMLGCDNRIAHELMAAGYHVTNPCHSIRTHHVHQSGIRQDPERRPDNTVPGPYHIVHPSHL